MSGFDDMLGRREMERPPRDLRYALWNAQGRFWHLFGIHNWVVLEEWDMESGAMRSVGLVCWHCPARSG